MNEDLRPCAHCGSEAELHGNEFPYNPSWKFCKVVCKDCGVSTVNFSTLKEAIEAWNRRV